MSYFDLVETRYGFKYGPIEVTRLLSDDRVGVVLEITTDAGRRLEIRSSPAGRRLEVSK